MCEPTTWIMLASALVGVVGQVQQGQASKAAGKANARVQSIMAADAIARGEADEASQRRRTAAFKGRQAAAFGASGAEINTGSALEILADTAQFGELDALRIRSNAEREAFGFLSGAAISRAAGENAATSANLAGFGTVLGAGGMVSEKWSVWKADNPSGSFGGFLTNTPPVLQPESVGVGLR